MGLPITLITHLFLVYKLTKLYDVTRVTIRRIESLDEILLPTSRPRGDADSLELFRLKNDFMYSVFNKCLLSDMGKTIVRKHLDNMNV